MSSRYSSVLAGCVLGLTLTSIIGSPAQARRIAFDVDDVIKVTSPCVLGAGACSGFDLPFPIISSQGTFTKVFVYREGIVSLGTPLPATASIAGGAASLGSSFIASGFADYGADLPNVYLTYADLNFEDENGNPFVGEFRVTWAYEQDDKPIFDVAFTDLSVTGFGLPKDPSRFGDVQAAIGHGSPFPNWTLGYKVQEEPFLPDGALVGWKIGDLQSINIIPSSFDLDDADFVLNLSAVPEPGTWLMMTAGFGLLGAQLRRRSARVHALLGVHQL